ncbi:hypothetical protein FNF27_06922 [Cafeteria roenbergensis]|uniref:Gamma-glutamyltransferase n=1 Tax=Cafeteria roenbergensis TaxID=33653 RepID=A0A5A8DYH0_CAFRO|nr:hypothetical protein FNF27_06922 [Cafeteria roenbergensis]
MVASTQPHANNAGMEILRSGGNAVDAAVAMAAALNVCEPTSTGIGGDAFALFFRASDKTVHAMNGSGRSPAGLSLERVLADLPDGATELPPLHAHCVTVPGAAAAWADSVAKWGSGSLSLAEVLAPAVKLARDGVPIGPIAADMWARSADRLRASGAANMLVSDAGGARAPRTGELWRSPALAATFEALGEGGKAAFYGAESPIAKAIVAAVAARGGTMSLEDLGAHSTEWPTPISVPYAGRVRVWECPPNGQGVAALIALNIAEAAAETAVARRGPAGEEAARGGTPLGSLPAAERAHILLCSMRLAFADARRFVADPAATSVPTEGLLSKAYAATRASQIPPFDGEGEGVVGGDAAHGAPEFGSDTVSFQVVDSTGNAVAYINSNYMGFGSFIEPEGTGFTLQNRGANFSLDATHPNCVAPSKRPYHTIIPCLGTLLSDEPSGGPPQGHLQVVSNLVDMGMEPQAALDAPRFCIEDGSAGGEAFLEDGTPAAVASALAARGHKLGRGDGEGGCVDGWHRSLFGRGQVIWRDDSGTLWGGSDPRGDGCAAGW